MGVLNISKGFRNVIGKIGVDRILHFFVAAWFVSECKYHGVQWCLFGYILIVTFAIIKEYVLDNKADFKDGLWTFFGATFSVLLMTLDKILKFLC